MIFFAQSLGKIWAKFALGNKKRGHDLSQPLEIIWLGERGSNPHSRSQSPLSFH